MSSLTLMVAGGHGFDAAVIKGWNFGPGGNRHAGGLATTDEGLRGNPWAYNGPAGIQGSPQDDQIMFTFERPVFFNIHNWYAGVFSFGVTQRRLADGRLIVEAQRQGAFMRACWTIGDRYTPDAQLSGSRSAHPLRESATGLMTISQYEQLQDSENVTMILYRGDAMYCKLHREIEDAVPDCDGGNGSAPPGGGDGGGDTGGGIAT